jgi:hypothetical protein
MDFNESMAASGVVFSHQVRIVSSMEVATVVNMTPAPVTGQR